MEASGRIVKIALPASSNDDYRSIRLRLNKQTEINMSVNLKRLPAGCLAEDIKRGAILTVSGTYSSGEKARNPGGFSEKDWFRSEGVSGKLTNVKIKGFEPAPSYYSPLHALDRFRFRILKLLEESFTTKTLPNNSSSASDFQPGTQGIMQALLMGHVGGLTAHTSIALREAGAYHLVCVSGMHLMFFLLPFRKISSFTSMGFMGQRRLLSIVVLFPALVSGFGHGVNRATLLFLLKSSDSKFQRRSDKINSLSIAGAILLIFQPFALRQNGFWMSFTAAAGLKLLSPKTKIRLINDLISSLGVFFILLPLTAKQQQGANLLAPFANVVLLPIASYLTVVGFFVLFLSLVFPFFSQHIYFLAGLLTERILQLWLKLVSAVANCRSTFLCNSQLITVAIIILCSFSVYLLLCSRYFKSALSVMLAMLVIVAMTFFRQDEELLEILFLDVGQGDSSLILLPRGPTILIDGGAADMGYQRILPALRSQGRDHVDLALLTHGHADHVLGVIELMSLGRVDCLLLPETLPDNDVERESTEADSARNSFDLNEYDWMSFILKITAEEKIPVKQTMAGEQFTLSDVEFSFIAPDHEDLKRSGDVNNTSLVFYLDYYQHSFLFTADMTKETEERLVRSKELRPVDYLHVAHHGSRLTSGNEFLDQIEARWAIISVGENNLYNHPHPDTLDRLHEHNITSIRLDKNSAFFLRLSKADSRIVLWQ